MLGRRVQLQPSFRDVARIGSPLVDIDECDHGNRVLGVPVGNDSKCPMIQPRPTDGPY